MARPPLPPAEEQRVWKVRRGRALDSDCGRDQVRLATLNATIAPSNSPACLWPLTEPSTGEISLESQFHGSKEQGLFLPDAARPGALSTAPTEIGVRQLG